MRETGFPQDYIDAHCDVEHKQIIAHSPAKKTVINSWATPVPHGAHKGSIRKYKEMQMQEKAIYSTTSLHTSILTARDNIHNYA